MAARIGFNPRTRVGCDLRPIGIWALAVWFQSTHPRGVRRDLAPISVQQHPVSIHAPAWGATCCHISCSLEAVRFNPRTRVGCDVFSLPCKRLVEEVSIHAPAWGATPCALIAIAASSRFQSTHPRGVRQVTPTVVTMSKRSFNPRTRVGCDMARPIDWPASARFQSTHPRGVRRSVKSFKVRGDSFNPRTRVGCDHLWHGQYSDQPRFQSTHPRGVRLFPCFIQ